MANLYQLSAAFMACEKISDDEVVNVETGEVLNIAYLDALDMERTDKLESCALYIKNMNADIEAFKAEIARLQEAKRVMDNKVERMKKYIADNMFPGEEIKRTRCALSWRASEAVEFDESFDMANVPEEAIKRAEPTVDKVVLKKLLKGGQDIPGVAIVKRSNLQVK